MRMLVKSFVLQNVKYIFDGNSLELFRVINEDDISTYMAQNDTSICKKQVVNGNSISKVVLNVSNKCNLRCKYCYADGGQYASKKDELMSMQTLKDIIAELHSKGIKRIGVVFFFGGEPLLNYPLIKSGIELFNNTFEIRNYEIVTNAWYLNEENITFFKENHVNLAISIDGPQDITDLLRGKGSYAKVLESLHTAKQLGYYNIECSATYTKYHEELGYTYDDINKYFNKMGIKATISRVISENRNMKPTYRPTKEEIRNDIRESARKIYDNQVTGVINPYLYQTLMSLTFGTRSINYCDDLMGDFSIDYDYDGKKYNCFHFWGDKKYAVKEEKLCNDNIQVVNDKDNNVVCKMCWAKYLCKICTASIMQNTMKWPVMNSGECSDRNIFEMCIECIIEYHLEEKVKQLTDNFVRNFIHYQ